MIFLLRLFLWRMDLYPRHKCPICRSQLIESGYNSNDDEFSKFKCVNNKCMFKGGRK